LAVVGDVVVESPGKWAPGVVKAVKS
jgi:hypothetical protein